MTLQRGVHAGRGEYAQGAHRSDGLAAWRMGVVHACMAHISGACMAQAHSPPLRPGEGYCCRNLERPLHGVCLHAHRRLLREGLAGPAQ